MISAQNHIQLEMSVVKTCDAWNYYKLLTDRQTDRQTDTVVTERELCALISS